MTTVPLNKLTSWPDNVRKIGAHEGIDELPASIAAHGLLQSLVVRRAAWGKFGVVAGQRRVLALSVLVERNQVPTDFPVECRLVEADANAAGIGLAENVVRQPMHPADQFEAFRNLIDEGSSAADVAARFGVKVRHRLISARRSPAGEASSPGREPEPTSLRSRRTALDPRGSDIEAAQLTSEGTLCPAAIVILSSRRRRGLRPLDTTSGCQGTIPRCSQVLCNMQGSPTGRRPKAIHTPNQQNGQF
jgi:ParB/RepB/Spo0J family partition protein